uniref:Cationic amino acid transporter 4 n=1 Tax=Plectus sambesii TaxID=2011161 RepID=A0A914UVL4_9BILA
MAASREAGSCVGSAFASGGEACTSNHSRCVRHSNRLKAGRDGAPNGRPLALQTGRRQRGQTAAMGAYELRERLFRLKSIGADFLDTQLRRCLSTFDITLLGVGHMIGAGIYVLTGSVVRNTAGPGIVLSFIFAGFASLLSALCYAEFGARVPKAGSAYTYTYITVGEFWAFIIGWNIILEHMLGAAAVARSWSGYLDSLLGHVIKNATVANVGSMEESSLFGDYPDIVAFLVVIAVAVFMGYGAKASTNFNTIFTFINLGVILFVVVFGFSFADFSLWSGTDPITGYSRFMPMGFNGVLAGAASCF